jgi:hypothetical protein
MFIGLPFADAKVPEFLDVGYTSWSIFMIESRIYSGECFCPEDFLMVQGSIGLSELCVSFLWKFPQSLITWQVSLALRFRGLYNSVPQDSQPLDLQLYPVPRL